jgi:hypothetical protein
MKIILAIAISLLALYLYISIVPCQDKNNNVEGFELPAQFDGLFYDRTKLLKEQTVKTNMLKKTILNTSNEIKRLKNKVEMIISESDNNSGETYMINTNGDISKNN